jgi:hypothetical protein
MFLCSDRLDKYQSMGENGQAVHISALQLRETLRLRKQSAVADTLAIPQVNEHGDRIDWYAPPPVMLSRGRPPPKVSARPR